MSCRSPDGPGTGHWPASSLSLFLVLLLFLGRTPALPAQSADSMGPIRDGGINPANLGKGDWIYFVSQATNKLGGTIPSVVSIPTLMSYCKAQGLQYLVVKAATGSTNFLGGGVSPQFTAELVNEAHRAGLLIFAYTRSYDDDVPGEIAMAAHCFALGADGWVIDAEAEWENGANEAGPNGPARALQYGQGLRALFPNKFIAHAPFPIISYHPSFPYAEFGYYCDAVMPQAYWKSIYGNVSNAVGRMVADMDAEYRAWQNSLTGVWTNAIKPLAPVGQNYNPSITEITTSAEVDEFFDRLRTNPAPASITGYRGISFWRSDTKTPDMWTAIRTNDLGDRPGPPFLTWQPQSRRVTEGTAAISFTAWGLGSKPFYYAWRFNESPLPGGSGPTLTLTNVQFSHAGRYSVVVSNISGVVTSQVAVLEVTPSPALVDIRAIGGARSAIVTWRSTNAGSSQVEFGLTTNLGTFSQLDSRNVTQHSVPIAGLAAGSTYYYAVLTRISPDTFRSTLGSFTTTGSITMDNVDASFTGNWSAGTTSPDKFGLDYRYTGTVNGGNTGSAIFTPLVTTSGYYDVYVWYPEGSNRSTNAPVVVNYSGGGVLTRLNQTSGGGLWRQVGTNLSFRAGTNANVRISNSTSETNRIVVADAVRLVYRNDQERPATPTVPAWWSEYYFGAVTNPLLDHDHDGHPDWAEYLAGTAPNDPFSRLQLWTEPGRISETNFTIYFSPALPDRHYELEQRTDTASWNPLPSRPIIDNLTGVGAFPMTNAPLTVRYYRLKVDWAAE